MKELDTIKDFNYDRFNDEAFDFMMNINEDDDRKLEVFKDEDGEWYVDMTQFGKIGDGRVVSKKHMELSMMD